MGWTGKLDHLFIGGNWVRPRGQGRLEVVNPATEEVIATVPSSSREDADAAVAAARYAFDSGPWPQMPLGDRLEILSRFRDLYADHEQEMARLISQEMGCPISLSVTFQAAAPRMILESYLELAQSYPFRTIRRASTGSALVTREPVGVVAGVIPWNVPQSIAMLKVAPALVSGCTMVLKPSPETPLDAYLMAELLERAGLPSGVFNLLPADRDTSQHLVSHPGVDKVAFTGSTNAGRRVAAICGQGLRRVTLELGGKSAAIFLDDADLDDAVERLRLGSLRNSGQVCSLKTRLVVSKRRERGLVDRLVALVESMPMGDPFDPSTQIGPMASARHRRVVEDYIDIGLGEGARAVVGGGRPSGYDHGWYVEPTIFTGVSRGSRIAQEEIFGPVLAVLTYETEDEAVAIANDSGYGLNGAVFTADPQRGLSVASRIRTGTVELNGNAAGLHAPAGGFKSSGIGREQGYEGLDSYTETRSVGVPPSLADALELVERHRA
ncbi:aldehyde dehydrogenase [Acidothermaceae bacterium B102]|nr:aldehyde dehydrogenase [Acidothermaceae bacterium B102]